MMTSRSTLQVVLLGFGRSRIAPRLVEALRANGVRVKKVASACELAAAHDPRERLALLIDCRRGCSQALEALDCVRRRSVPATASVLVGKTDFGQYYRLMGAGAKGFFSPAEKPSFIARGLQLMAQP